MFFFQQPDHVMNRHFYNFVAIFNANSRTRKGKFVFPLRTKKLIYILYLLNSLGFIREFSLPDKWSYGSGGNLRLGKKRSNYYHPVKVVFKSGFFPRIKSISTPGKQYSYNYKKLLRLHNRLAGMATIIVSSSVTGKICTSTELLQKGDYGALVLFIIFHHNESARWKSKKTFP